MSSLKDNFNELMERVRQGSELGHASCEPIYYLVFSPRQLLDVKREMPGWIARLRNDGWEVIRFSIAQEIAAILEKAPLRKIWLGEDRKSPLSWDKTNKSLQNALANEKNGPLRSRLDQALEQAKDKASSTASSAVPATPPGGSGRRTAASTARVSLADSQPGPCSARLLRQISRAVVRSTSSKSGIMPSGWVRHSA